MLVGSSVRIKIPRSRKSRDLGHPCVNVDSNDLLDIEVVEIARTGWDYVTTPRCATLMLSRVVFFTAYIISSAWRMMS